MPYPSVTQALPERYPSGTQALPKRYPSVIRNLVPRGKSDTDGRAQHLHLTPAGKSLATKALKLLLATDAISMPHLSEGERMILVELLLRSCCSGRV